MGGYKINISDNPAPVIMAKGIDGGGLSQYWIEIDMQEEVTKQQEKPLYRVPLMSEIAAIDWNGLTVASTFSGAGGSCTGYRMAGYKVLWANEFVPIAQESYKANHPDSILDPRDIRLIQAKEILKVCGLKKGELDIFDGSPPCQAFSTAGKREKGWGKDKTYEHGAKQKNETLFSEYIRLLEGLKPKVFIAENVSGLVKGTAKGFFLNILRDLKNTGYQVQARLLDAQWLGVPQQRQRIIFIGVRNDLKLSPAFPAPLSYRYSVRDALPWIDQMIVGNNAFESKWGDATTVSPTVVASGANKQQGFVKDFHESGGFSRTECREKPSPAITATQCRMTIEVETSIENYAIGDEWDNLKEGEQSSKYFNLQKANRELPDSAILASHGNSSTASVVHPTEKRKFTIEELKRICAFPDDYVLKGSYAQQWERLGNSVPPLMMKAIAEVIRDEILLKLKK